MFHEMTVENTPAWFIDDEAGDESMSERNDPGRIEVELFEHVRAHPKQFIGTEFAGYARRQSPATSSLNVSTMAGQCEADVERWCGPHAA